MVKRSAIKIKSELMERIGYQTTKTGFSSKTQFAEDAVEKEWKRLELEQNASVLDSNRQHYSDRRSHYAEQGIMDFEEFVAKGVLNEDVINTIKKVEKKSNKKIDKLEKKLKIYAASIKFLETFEILRMPDINKKTRKHYKNEQNKAKIELIEDSLDQPDFLKKIGTTREKELEQIKKLKQELKK